MKTSHFLVLVVSALFPLTSNAIEISGYYENTLVPEYSDDSRENIIDASKLRIEFSAGNGENELRFDGDVLFTAYHSGIELDLAPYLPQAVSDTLAKWDAPSTFSYPEQRVLLDNAYLTWEADRLRFRLGRQQLSWGPAYSFNPTDLFHSKDMLDPSYVKPGVTALRADYRWGVGGQLTAIMAPGRDVDGSGYAMRLGTHLSKIGYDVALTIHHVEDSTSLIPVDLTPFHQDRNSVGFEFSGSLFGPGIWLEGNFNDMELEDDFIRAVLGMDYTLDNGVYIMWEALYNGRGENEAPYSATSWMGSIMFGEPVTQQRHMFGLRKSLTDLSEGSLYSFIGADGTYLFSPRLDVSIAQNADLVLFGAASTGKEDGQFPGGLIGMTARLSVYF
ncbi:hypothetical protein ACFLQV_01745 [Calditrichota bacterium]